MTGLAWLLHSHCLLLTRLWDSNLYIQATSTLSSFSIEDLSEFYHFFKKTYTATFIREAFLFLNQTVGAHRAQSFLSFNPWVKICELIPIIISL